MTALILSRCRELGFALAGVAAAEPSRYEHELRGWLADGRHGEMAWLDRNTDKRLDPRTLVPGAKSVICVADRYHDGAPDGARGPGPPRGRVARYARGDDYHRAIGRRLRGLADELASEFPGHTMRACVDTAPVLEREIAQRAGLGAVGKHTLLIEPGVGSYLLLGQIITTLELEPSAARGEDPCGACTRCIDACPTGAISPFSVDATRCISYLTIEHRSAIDPSLHGPMGDWIFGCDVCQEVCPHNQPTRRTRAAPVSAAYRPRRESFDLLEVLGWTEEARRDAFIRSAMKRARLSMMKRNALIAAGNALRSKRSPELRRRVEEIAGDPSEDPMVRDTAREAISD